MFFVSVLFGMDDVHVNGRRLIPNTRVDQLVGTFDLVRVRLCISDGFVYALQFLPLLLVLLWCCGWSPNSRCRAQYGIILYLGGVVGFLACRSLYFDGESP